MSNPLANAYLEAGTNITGRAAVTDRFSRLLAVDSDGVIQIGGSTLTRVQVAGGTDIALTATNGLKINSGTGTLDGSNPTSIAHGLTTCTSFVATLIGTSAPGDDTSVLTANINGANVDVYAWKNTGGTDPTLVASTGVETFYWIATGT